MLTALLWDLLVILGIGNGCKNKRKKESILVETHVSLSLSFPVTAVLSLIMGKTSTQRVSKESAFMLNSCLTNGWWEPHDYCF